MSSSGIEHEEIAKYYKVALDALYEVARTYFFLGRLDDARHLLTTSLQVFEAQETMPQHRLKLLLLYGRILLVKQLLRVGDTPALFSTLEQARWIAEEIQDQQAIAEALSLLGQAHYSVNVTAGVILDSPDSGKYNTALAYQQQALELREALHNQRGISESYFQIGVIHERWQDYDRAAEYYKKARQIADQYDYPFEKTEPARHLAVHALKDDHLDQALQLGLEALKLREEASFKPYQPLDHILLRDAYLAKGDAANAELHTRKATALAEEMGLTALISSLPNIREALASRQKKA
ncbi:tetratricopeptide repeat protein [Ktedonosporobacter rubrisoli]|uniref:Tetratricopeptide repeat protein n=1 Tax=Ktedonosporobacter rubrisoli TaxID=2509675 RepID=A0A4P6K4V7_KTERU|nr:tetratricopeptide repeat protein [Ktedonosporobacter rubrisoli]QBD83289.1 tetratricopeptide repeat protein [Ktedonosporobacter rubrisoli]